MKKFIALILTLSMLMSISAFTTIPAMADETTLIPEGMTKVYEEDFDDLTDTTGFTLDGSGASQGALSLDTVTDRGKVLNLTRTRTDSTSGAARVTFNQDIPVHAGYTTYIDFDLYVDSYTNIDYMGVKTLKSDGTYAHDIFLTNSGSTYKNDWTLYSSSAYFTAATWKDITITLDREEGSGEVAVRVIKDNAPVDWDIQITQTLTNTDGDPLKGLAFYINQKKGTGSSTLLIDNVAIYHETPAPVLPEGSNTGLVPSSMISVYEQDFASLTSAAGFTVTDASLSIANDANRGNVLNMSIPGTGSKYTAWFELGKEIPVDDDRGTWIKYDVYIPAYTNLADIYARPISSSGANGQLWYATGNGFTYSPDWSNYKASSVFTVGSWTTVKVRLQRNASSGDVYTTVYMPNGIQSYTNTGLSTADGANLKGFKLGFQHAANTDAAMVMIDDIAVWQEPELPEDPGTSLIPNGMTSIYEQDFDGLSALPSEVSYVQQRQSNGTYAQQTSAKVLADELPAYKDDVALRIPLTAEAARGIYFTPSGGIPLSSTETTYIEYDVYSSEANTLGWTMALGNNSGINHFLNSAIVYATDYVSYTSGGSSVGTRTDLPQNEYMHIVISLKLEENGNIRVICTMNDVTSSASRSFTVDGAPLNCFGILSTKGSGTDSCFYVDNIAIYKEICELKRVSYSLTSNGTPVNSIGDIGTDLKLNASFINTTAAAVTIKPYIALYKGTELVTAVKGTDLPIAAKTSTATPITEFGFADVSGYDFDTVKLFFWDEDYSPLFGKADVITAAQSES